jgi:hypothetical protein
MTDAIPFKSRRARLPVLVLTNPVQDAFPVMIARRGLRLHNRDARAARRYEDAHKALKKELSHG